MADVELVIKIPEEVLKTRYYDDFFGCGSTTLTAVLDKGKPLDEVLDGIKAEIEDYEADCNYHLSEDDNCKNCNNITFRSIYRIIDNCPRG